jgi:hypothetical protein
MGKLVLRTRADSEDLARAATALEQASWNQFGFLNFTKAHYAHYERLLEEYADYQQCLVDEETGYPIAVANCVPMVASDEEIDNLPPEGWDWVVERAAASRGQTPNTLGGLAISVPNVHRGKGIGRVMIKAMHDLSIRKGFKAFLAPVRPSAKMNHPFVSIDEYCEWKDDKGRFFDPWMRSHAASGGEYVKPCLDSMVVEEPIGFWQTWTEQPFPKSGCYAIEGALSPVHIDLERNVGRYAEPNVWFVYKN